MIRKRFIKSNPVILGCYTVAPNSSQKQPIKFLENGVTDVVIKIGEIVITDEGVTTEFNNDEGKLTIHRNDFAIESGHHEIEVYVIDQAHPSPGQLIIDPLGEHDSKVVLIC